MNNTYPVDGKAADHATAAAATAVVITYAANAERHVIGQIFASYSAAPTGGLITVEDGSGVVIFRANVLVGGALPITFNPPLAGSPNTAMIITLASGAGAVVGLLTVRHWTQNF